MEKQSLVSLYDFENRQKLFPAVDSRMKFCLLTVTGLARPAKTGAEFVFFAHDMNELKNTNRNFTLSAKDIVGLTPNTKTCPTFLSKTDSRISISIYKQIPIFNKFIGKEKDGCWDCDIERGFRQGEDAESLQRLGFDEDKLLYTDDEIQDYNNFIALYEGKTFDIFNHRAASIVYKKTALYRPRQPVSSSRADYINPLYFPKPYYWVKKEVAKRRIPWDWFIAFKKSRIRHFNGYPRHVVLCQ